MNETLFATTSVQRFSGHSRCSGEGTRLIDRLAAYPLAGWFADPATQVVVVFEGFSYPHVGGSFRAFERLEIGGAVPPLGFCERKMIINKLYESMANSPFQF